MARSVEILGFLMLAAAVPATAQTFGLSIGSAPQACLSIGGVSYRVAANPSAADLTVRIDPAAGAPDLRIHLAETADEADFVFVDDGDAPPACLGGAHAKSVRVDPAAAAPDLTIGVAGTAATADYRIYVRSGWLAAETAAALFAVAHAPAKKPANRVAHRSN